jgi:small subunit ribosomal protein S6
MDKSKENFLRKYEAVVILHPDSSEADQKTIMRKNADTIKSFGGTIHHLDTWGKRRLANPINKSTVGIYFHTTFEAKGDAVAELERTMRINDKVLRFLHSRLDDRENLGKFLEKYRAALQETANRESEREAKAQARKAAFSARREGGGGRDFGGGRDRDFGGGRDRDFGGGRDRDFGGGRDRDFGGGRDRDFGGGRDSGGRGQE